MTETNSMTSLDDNSVVESFPGTFFGKKRRKYSLENHELIKVGGEDNRHHRWKGWGSSNNKDSDSRRTATSVGVLDPSRSFMAKEGDEESTISNVKDTLQRLIEADNVTEVETILLKHSYLLEERDENGLTLIAKSTKMNAASTVSLLLSLDANVNVQCGAEKTTPLHLAAQYGSSDSICNKLIDAGAKIDAQDISLMTPLIWACYKGFESVTKILLERGAHVSMRDVHQMSPIIWASGRGFLEIVNLLISMKCHVDIGDKFGTTPLIWATRNGHVSIVRRLIECRANVDANGMYSWTPLFLAVKNNHGKIVDLLLEHTNNINVADVDGLTPLAIACKDGFAEIAIKLMEHGSYVNVQDKSEDTVLIHAVKGGYLGIVESLIRRHVDIDSRGKDGKTCVHWAVDKNHMSILRRLLTVNPDLEMKTTEGETPLFRAVKSKNVEAAQILLDKKAKISTVDNKGDNVLHMAMRCQSKSMVDCLLRNPRHSYLLYRPNKAGQTPYQIDCDHDKSLLGQIFGGSRLNTNQHNEGLLGYDLFSSALADILTEPKLSMPIVVGLYAKWGSGKGFMVKYLKNEMQQFAINWTQSILHITPVVFLILFHVSMIIGLLFWFTLFLLLPDDNQEVVPYEIGILTTLTILFLSYLFLLSVQKGVKLLDWTSLYTISVKLARKIQYAKLMFYVVFYHPPGKGWRTNNKDNLPLRLLFTEQCRVASAGGKYDSINQLIGSLLDEIELHYGKVAIRFCRALTPTPSHSSSPWLLRRICCIPAIFIYMLTFILSFIVIILTSYILKLSANDQSSPSERNIPKQNLSDLNEPTFSNASTIMTNAYPLMSGLEEDMNMLLMIDIACSVVLALILVSNFNSIYTCIKSLMKSQRCHLQECVTKQNLVKSDGYLQVVNSQIRLMTSMVYTMDAFTDQQTRFVIIVDGLDSCEQVNVLYVLESLNMLCSEHDSPFIILLAIDPHVITKAIEINMSDAFSRTSIGGNTYLQNLVHLPFFLQNAGLRKVKAAQKAASQLHVPTSLRPLNHNTNTSTSQTILPLTKTNIIENHLLEGMDEFNSSNETSFAKKSSATRLYNTPSTSKGGGGIKFGAPSDSLGESINGMNNNTNSNLHRKFTTRHETGNKILLHDHYLSDINPRSLRRLTNIVYIMGRLMKAFNIEFNWYHLSSWTNMTEQWPYRLSWIIFVVDKWADESNDFDNKTSLYTIYFKIKEIVPNQKELEPLLEMDREEKKLLMFLKHHEKTLTLVDLKIFLPFTINLDPYIKKVIREEMQQLEEIGITVSEILSRNNVVPENRRKKSTIVKESDQIQLFKSKRRKSFTMDRLMVTNVQDDDKDKSNEVEFSDNQSKSSQTSLEKYEQSHSEMILQKPLINYTVEEMCHLIHNIPSIQHKFSSKYCEIMKNENINGLVLSKCQMDDLRNTLQMTFGDWEIFKYHILSLRKVRSERFETSANVRTTNKIYERCTSIDQESSLKKTVSNVTITATTGNKKTMEYQQVNMEDAMISNMLASFNEEASEDVMCEEERRRREDLHNKDSQSLYLDNTDEMINKEHNYSDEQETDIVYISNDADGQKTIVAEEPHNNRSFDESTKSKYQIDESKSSVSRKSSDNVTENHERKDSKKAISRLLNKAETKQQRKQKYLGRCSSRRYIRDRLNSLASYHSRCEEEEEDPYAWISATAPTTPRPPNEDDSNIDIRKSSNADDWVSSNPGTSDREDPYTPDYQEENGGVGVSKYLSDFDVEGGEVDWMKGRRRERRFSASIKNRLRQVRRKLSSVPNPYSTKRNRCPSTHSRGDFSFSSDDDSVDGKVDVEPLQSGSARKGGGENPQTVNRDVDDGTIGRFNTKAIAEICTHSSGGSGSRSSSDGVFSHQQTVERRPVNRAVMDPLAAGQHQSGMICKVQDIFANKCEEPSSSNTGGGGVMKTVILPDGQHLCSIDDDSSI